MARERGDERGGEEGFESYKGYEKVLRSHSHIAISVYPSTPFVRGTAGPRTRRRNATRVHPSEVVQCIISFLSSGYIAVLIGVGVNLDHCVKVYQGKESGGYMIDPNYKCKQI
jgi:hypothetical protein